jgi:regulatory protein YycH of two-component signal transduction system YycFG
MNRYDWRNLALTILVFFVIVLSYAVITGVCK